jgi:hypothetical protein
MSTQTQEPVEMGTKPINEHEWLQQFVGDWRVETEMWMGPGQPAQRVEGTEHVKSVGGLWAFGERRSAMPNGKPMERYWTLGYDISFKEYRGCWFASVSSHLWKQTGQLSADGKVLTLDCVGPSMIIDGETANYRDVVEIIDEKRRTVTAYGPGETGEWQQFLKSTYTRI